MATPYYGNSLLWQLHSHKFDPSAAPLTLFEEAYTTTHKMVRIYKVKHTSDKSRQWRAAKGVECASQASVHAWNAQPATPDRTPDPDPRGQA